MKKFYLHTIKYRIHIIFLYFLLLLSFNLKSGLHQAILISSAFTLINAYSYILNRFTDFEGDYISNSNEALSYNIKIFLFLLLILLFSFFIFINYTNGISVFFIFLFISSAYSVKFGDLQLRKIFFIKNFWAASSWYLSIFFSIYLNNQNFLFIAFINKTLPLFFYILGIEIYYDIKDISGDKISKTKTIPVVFGTHIAKTSALLFMFPQTFYILTKSYSFEKILFLIVFIIIYYTRFYKISYHLPIYLLILYNTLIILNL